MAFLFKLLGTFGLILFIAVVPNLRALEGFRKDFLPMALSILMVGVGLLLDRLDQVLACVKAGTPKPPA